MLIITKRFIFVITIIIMFKLDSSIYLNGLEADAAMILGALQNIATLTPPITIADIRSQLETGQVQPFTDGAFNEFLQRCHDLPVTQADLTTAEKTILNVIREELNPPVNFATCGGTTYPTGTGITIENNDRVGSATYEKEVRIISIDPMPCDVAYITLTIVAASGTPPAAVPSSMDVNKIGTIDGYLTFSYLWLDFASDPTGGSYSYEINYKDSSGSILASTAVPVSF